MYPTLASAVRAHGLTEQEAYVIEQRLAGRSYGQIAEDDALGRSKKGGGRFTRQRVKQFEQDAARKLGLSCSIEEVVHRSERFDAAMRLRERAKLLFSGEACAAGPEGLGTWRRPVKQSPREAELERMAD